MQERENVVLKVQERYLHEKETYTSQPVARGNYITQVMFYDGIFMSYTMSDIPMNETWF